MKRLMFAISPIYLALGGGSASGQGTIVFNNLRPNNGEVRFNVDGCGGEGSIIPLDRDLNFGLLVGPADGLTSPSIVRTWLLSDGTANGINVAPGRFADPSHSVIVLPGIAPGSAISVIVTAWEGNYSTIGEAYFAGARIGGAGFTMGAGSAAGPPANLSTMPELLVNNCVIPEPSTWSLLCVGAFGLLIGRKRERGAILRIARRESD